MKIYSLLLSTMFILITGCSCPPPPEPIHVIDTVYVNIPVKCVVPEVNCDFKGNGYTPTVKLLDCIIEQKRALEVCSRSIKDNNTSK